ncbi:flagellar hook-length control protein FliK [Natranaerovirga hydrolytica]|uniref:Flagellar hook-length control protein FliK n=1 Tax=Natranaerovirga hydrolytica TaxID=680378 RepID=A0A4R1N5M8_9FIRM|nr:flagellar hook-length control protein FliK [Natranaerovirga hydrolytica]TCK98299.1 flagellar hook-length control protein FliK [Natranaerovirga hydrolytica]
MRISLDKSNQYIHLDKMKIKEQVLKTLQIGDIFEGEIDDIRHSLMQIKLKNNQFISARLLEQLEVNIGDKFLFQVKDKNNDQIIIKPYIDEKLTQGQQKIIQALEEANIPVNEKNMEVVKQLLFNQMPIHKENIKKYVQINNMHNESSIEDIIFLEKNNIPITKTNLEQLHLFKENEHSLIYKFDKFFEEVSSKLQAYTSEQTDTQDSHTHLLNLHSQLKDIIDKFNGLAQDNQDKEVSYNPVNQSETQNSIQLSQNEKEMVYDIIKSSMDLTVTKEEFVSNKMTLESIFQLIEKMPTDKKQVIIAKMVQDNVYEPLVRKDLLEQLFFSPKEVNKENLTHYYRALEDIIESAMNRSEGQLSQLANTKESIDFMKQLNEIIHYIQIPVKLKNQNVHSELYVYKNNEQNNKQSKASSVLLRLDFAHLGHIDIFLEKNNYQINSKFYIENDETKDILNTNLYGLTKVLKEKGYDFSSQIMTDHKKLEFPNDIMPKDQTSKVQRFSFDIRV